MTGGEAFLLDPDERLLNDELVVLTPLEQQDADRLQRLLERHARATGSARAAALLDEWELSLGRFRKAGAACRGRGARGGERGPAHRLGPHNYESFMHTMQMPYVSIVGAAGYTGQETLDRVLAHPELELYAVGSDSLAGSDATSLDPRLNRNGGKRVPRLITNEAALACEADVTFVCLPHEDAACPRAAVARDRRRSLRRPPAVRSDAVRGVVRLHAPEARGSRRVVVRIARALPAERTGHREPRLLRDRRAPRPRPARR